MTSENTRGTFQILAENIALALEPLVEAVSDLDNFKAFMYRLGWEVNSVPSAFTSLGNLVKEAQAIVESLPDDASVPDVNNLLEKIKEIYSTIKSITEIPDGVNANDFLPEEVAEQIFEILLTDYLADKFPSIFKFLQMFGIIEKEYHQADNSRPEFIRTKFRFERLEGIVSNPPSLLEMVYGWGTETLKLGLIAEHIHGLFHSINIPTSIERVNTSLGKGYQPSPEKSPKAIDFMIRIPIFRRSINDVPVEGSMSILELPKEEDKKPGLIVQPNFTQNIDTKVEIDENTTLNIRGGTDLSSVFGIMVRPEQILVRYPFQSESRLPESGFGITVDYAPNAPRIILGSQQNSRLELKGFTWSLNLDYNQEQSELIFVSEVQLKDLLFIISKGEQDSLMTKILGENDLVIPIPISIVWSSETGFHFKGSSGLSVSINPHLSIGNLKIDQLTFEILSGDRVDVSPNFAIHVLLSISGTIGPVAFSMDGIGLQLKSVFKDGNAGPLDLSLDVIPPRGM